MQTFFFFITSILASAIAVKCLSAYLKAKKTDFLSSLIAVVLSLLVLTTIGNLVPIELIGLVLSVLLVGFVLESILETSFKNGMIIAAAAILVQWLIKFGFIQLGVNTDMLLFVQQLFITLKSGS